MNRLVDTIDKLVPSLYEERRQILGCPRTSDMSHSNQCQNLTPVMVEALNNRGLPAYQEYHEGDNGTWHYLLVHESPDQEPSNSDLITDLNPWQGINTFEHTGHLHGPRFEVMEQMKCAGVPDYLIALRGIDTIVRHKTTH